MFATSENQFMKTTETFNANKLKYIVEHFEEYKDQLRPSVFEDDAYNPLAIAKNYLDKSIDGVINVDYRQNKGVGRFCAVKSLSLQNLIREIRHTISDGYYVDIDMKNAHPVILEYLCKKEGFACDFLHTYILEREKLLKDLKIDREKGKQVYLAITNGGIGDYLSLEVKTRHLMGYRDEMLKLHKNFSLKYPEEFKKVAERRKKAGKDYNHEAGFMNVLLCDMENKILMCMYDYFEKPENCVLCFDGIMLDAKKEYDIKGCEKYIKDKLGIDIQLSFKPFDNCLKIPENIPEHKSIRLNYYTDFRNIIKQDNIYLEWVERWAENSLVLIENDGKPFYLTRNKRVIMFSDKTKEIRDEWKPVKIEDIEKSLKIKCNIINPYYDYEFHQKYLKLKPKERKELGMTKEELNKKINKYIYGTLGNSNVRYGEGFLTHIMEERKIRSYNNIDFYPFLSRNGKPELEDCFNKFTEYPLEHVDIDYKNINFEESKLFKHLKTDFFRNNKDELNHFLDHIADLIQDPARIKGTSHLFYSPQGCGKGLLLKFMTKLLGCANVVSIINTDIYFDKNFNTDISNKLLKVFEEVSEKGSAFKNHNRLKGEQTSDTERVEPKGVDAYILRHCARFWYFTNNENSLYIENDDRRHTLHNISGKHANNYEYFKPIWDEIKNEKFLKSAFEYFSNRQYEEKNVMNAFTTQYKKEQKHSNLPKGIKFILHYISENIETIEDKDYKITSAYLKDKFRTYCDLQGTKYQVGALNTQIKKIGILEPRQLKIKDASGVSRKKFCYIINPQEIQNNMRKFLNDDEFNLDVKSMDDMEEVDESDVEDFNY